MYRNKSLFILTLLGSMLLSAAISTALASQTMTASVYRKVENVQQLIDSGQMQAAADALDSALRLKKLRPYEKAVLNQMYGALLLSGEKYSEAIPYYQQALSFKALPGPVTARIHYNLGQLYLTESRYQEGIEQFLAYIAATPSPVANAYQYLASAYSELKAHSQAIKYIKLAIAQSPEKKQLHEFLYGQYLLVDEPPNALATLDVLINLAPDTAAYWWQKTRLLLETGQSNDALVNSQLMSLIDLIKTPQEVLFYAGQLMEAEHYYLTLQLMERAFSLKKLPKTAENLQYAAQAALGAKIRDSAINYYLQAAVEGQSYRYLFTAAQIALTLNRYDKVLNVVDKAIDSNWPKDEKLPETEFLYLKGVAHFYLKEFEASRQVFVALLKRQVPINRIKPWLEMLEQTMDG